MYRDVDGIGVRLDADVDVGRNMELRCEAFINCHKLPPIKLKSALGVDQMRGLAHLVNSGVEIGISGIGL